MAAGWGKGPGMGKGSNYLDGISSSALVLPGNRNSAEVWRSLYLCRNLGWTAAMLYEAVG